MKSRLYIGRLRHRRHSPVAHVFDYRVFMPYICLDELPVLFSNSWLWSTRRWAAARFLRSDFLGDPTVPLQDEVRRRIFEETGERHHGPIYLLANLRYFGFNMNPISCYYCFNDNESQLEYLVAEVTNTPWKERHSYVLRGPEAGRWLRCDFAKQMHVSPFNPMNMRYHWRSNTPGERLALHLATTSNGEQQFDATLLLTGEPMTRRNRNRILWHFPFMTTKVCLAIYWQALQLFFKRAPFYTHPTQRPDGVSNE